MMATSPEWASTCSTRASHRAATSHLRGRGVAQVFDGPHLVAPCRAGPENATLDWSSSRLFDSTDWMNDVPVFGAPMCRTTRVTPEL